MWIVDESASAPGPEVEIAASDRIRRPAGHRTVVLLIHRMSGVRHADSIHVLNQGCLTETRRRGATPQCPTCPGPFMTEPVERTTVPLSSAAPATSPQTATPETLRNRLTDQFLAAGRIRTAPVEAAFRQVPRHHFAPEAALDAAYADGRVTSSISAPWIQADMLEAANLQVGQHVLEIGSGGYNAALAAEIVGPEGNVTTLDIDPLITGRARRFLDTTGYDHVRVVTADAGHTPQDLLPAGGFDAVIVTVETWDLPWTDLVAEGGYLVAPLRIHGYVWSIGFTKRNGILVSDGHFTVCGFVPMQGAGARHARLIPLRGAEIGIRFEDGVHADTAGFPRAFDTPKAEERTGVTVRGQEPLDNLLLWLAITLPSGFCRLAVDPDLDSGVITPPPPPHWPAAATIDSGTLARLATEKISDDGTTGTHELIVHAYGPKAEQQAAVMAAQVHRWDRDHRTGGYPRLRAIPLKNADRRYPEGQHLDKKHVRLEFSWHTESGVNA